jgi:hypothetical protein
MMGAQRDTPAAPRPARPTLEEYAPICCTFCREEIAKSLLRDPASRTAITSRLRGLESWLLTEQEIIEALSPVDWRNDPKARTMAMVKAQMTKIAETYGATPAEAAAIVEQQGQAFFAGKEGQPQ